jgi:hypothetical protein
VLQNKKWKDTKVEIQTNRKKFVINSVKLTQLDGRSFPLIKSAHFLYVVFTDDGLELAHIKSVSCDAAESVLMKKTRRKLERFR